LIVHVVDISTFHTSKNAKLLLLNDACILGGICIFQCASIGNTKLDHHAFGVITACNLLLEKSAQDTLFILCQFVNGVFQIMFDTFHHPDLSV
jgi:hypothetical protein